MISVRRLRAVLLFAFISAVGWGILGAVVSLVMQLWFERSVSDVNVLQRAGGFALFGALAGTAWAVLIALLPRREENVISPLVAMLAGTFGGLLVFMGIAIALGPVSLEVLSYNLILLGTMACIGGAVGLGIQRVAARGQLPAPEALPKALEP